MDLHVPACSCDCADLSTKNLHHKASTSLQAATSSGLQLLQWSQIEARGAEDAEASTRGYFMIKKVRVGS